MHNMNLEAKTINQKMRYLKVDISIDEQTQPMKVPEFGMTQVRSHSGIDTIYHI